MKTGWGGLNIGHLYQILDRLSRDGPAIPARGYRDDFFLKIMAAVRSADPATLAAVQSQQRAHCCGNCTPWPPPAPASGHRRASHHRRAQRASAPCPPVPGTVLG
jgi:hypothetical protein